jgi:mitochondrial fission protein ELM1
MTPTIWVLADERRGTANQALGVAEALGLPFEVKDIRHGALARLPNLLLGASRLGLSAASAASLQASNPDGWPDLVIAAGRRAGAAARWIKRQNKGKTRLVQIMYPGAIGAGAYDLIVAPRHDRVSGANVLEVDGAPHGVSETVLELAREPWLTRFASFAPPVVALILGGATIRRGFDIADGHALGVQVAMAVKASGGSLVVTSSPRTGAAIDGVLAGIGAAGIEPAFVHRWGQAGANPYLGFLAVCDALVVTGDSVSMLCEACAGTQAVYLYAPPGFVTAKHERLHRDLIAGGYVRPFAGRIESWTHSRLNAAETVAADIRRRFLS